MTDRNPAAPGDRLAADLFRGPRRIQFLLPLLRRLPVGVSRALLSTLAIGDGLVRGRFRRASRWAAAQGATGWRRHRMAFALLVNHGRFVAQEALVGVESSEDLASHVVLLGREHLDSRTKGALLLGFHLGPPKTWLYLQSLGYPIRFAGRLESTAGDPRWQAAIDSGVVIRMPSGNPQERLRGLMRIRQLLQDGAIVSVTADGPFGRTAFNIDLPGGPLEVRQGWLALRRAARVPTFPVLTYEEEGRRVIEIYPPLPDPDDDQARDAAACRAALTPLVQSYVRRFPTQCRWLAMPRWRSAGHEQDVMDI